MTKMLVDVPAPEVRGTGVVIRGRVPARCACGGQLDRTEDCTDLAGVLVSVHTCVVCGRLEYVRVP